MRGQIYGPVVTASSQTKARGQLDPRKSLQDPQGDLFFDDTYRNLVIAVIFVLKDQIIGLDCLKEGLVAQWFQPFHNVVHIFKNYHFTSLPKRGQAPQIWIAK